MSNINNENDKGNEFSIKSISKSHEFLNSVIKELESRQFSNKPAPTKNDAQENFTQKTTTSRVSNEKNSRPNSLVIPQPLPRSKKSPPPPPPPQKCKPNKPSRETKTFFEETERSDRVQNDIETLLNNAFKNQNRLPMPTDESLAFEQHRLHDDYSFGEEILGSSMQNRSCSMMSIDNLETISCYTYDSIDSEDFLMSPRRQSSSFDYENTNKNKKDKKFKVRKRDKLKEKFKWKTGASKDVLNSSREILNSSRDILNSSKEKVTDALLDIANQAGGKLKRLTSTRIKSGISKQRSKSIR